MKDFLKPFVFTAVLVFSSAQAAGEIPKQQDYAWRFPIRVESPAEFLALDLPLDVYQAVSDPQLRDLGVYNAAGQAVPRTIDRPAEKVDDVEHATALGMVPLHGEIEASQERLRLLMQRTGSGTTTLQFDSQYPEMETPPGQQLRAYIVDLRGRDERLSSLEFEWAEDVPDFIGSITVEDGDDLSGWRRLGGGTLAELEFQGTRIEQKRIEIPRKTGDFLRLTWQDMPDQWRLESISGIVRERGPEQEREWFVLSPGERSEDGRAFTFDVGGFPPVDRVSLILPGRNVVVRAGIDHRQGPDSGWQRGPEGLSYRISRQGREINSAPLKLAPTRDAQWRVRILSGQVDGPVSLRLGWRPDRLLFLAQGDAPYALATGRAQDRIEHFPQHRLLGDSAIFAMLERSGDGGKASIGRRLESAGAMVMEGARTWTWRTVLVWIGLVAAVLFVGWLAWSLMREAK